MKTGGWTTKEKARLIKAVEKHGKDFTKITEMVRTRDMQQVRTQTNYMKREFQKNPFATGAHILPALEKKLKRGRKGKDDEPE